MKNDRNAIKNFQKHSKDSCLIQSFLNCSDPKTIFAILKLLLFSNLLVAQVTVLSNQTITTPQYFSNLDTLIVSGCVFQHVIGDALKFENVKYVRVENSTFHNIKNTIVTRAAICGRKCDRVELRSLHIDSVFGTAIRIPIDGPTAVAQRSGSVVIDSVTINRTFSTGQLLGTGIHVFHTDTLVIKRSLMKNIDNHGIILGRNSTNPIQHNQRINYCEITACRLDSILGDGISSQENILGATIRNNWISNIAWDGSGVRLADGDHAMYWQARGAVIENNKISNVRDGLVSGPAGTGISLRTNAIVNANEISHCTGNGIGYYNDHPGRGMLRISNNVTYDNDRNGIYINGSNWDNINPARVRHPDTVHILNNTVFNQKKQDALIHSCPVALNNMSSKNLVAGNLLVYEEIADTNWYIRFLNDTPSQSDAHNFLSPSDPGFANFAGRDFRLQSICAAVDFIPTGSTYVERDFDGHNRLGQHDAGAYERCSGQSTEALPHQAVICEGETYVLGGQVFEIPGHYTIVLVASNGCDSLVELDLSVLAFESNFTYTQSGGQVLFSEGSPGATSWHWDFGDGNAASVPNPSHIYAEDGTYLVCLVTSNGICHDTFCQVIQVLNLSSGEPGAWERFVLLPASGSGKFVVSAVTGADTDLWLRVADAQGNVLYQQFYRQISHLEEAIDLNGQPSGVYFVQICTGSNCAVRRYVLMR